MARLTLDAFETIGVDEAMVAWVMGTAAFMDVGINGKVFDPRAVAIAHVDRKTQVAKVVLLAPLGHATAEDVPVGRLMRLKTRQPAGTRVRLRRESTTEV